MDAHMAHPSVRMKGTEADWIPLHCTDRECSLAMKGPHLHCPFCIQESLFTDQVLLKAHYRVKHVDKSIEFGGLKILRCCRSCVVPGIIHEQKYFKGSHWHCYHCHNGFSRRDEAMKHYRQPFRHPETTIQIVIARDVNQTLTTYTSSVPTSTSLVTHLIVPQSHQAIGGDSSTGYEQNDGQQVQYQYACTNDPNQSGSIGAETVVLIEMPDDGKGDFDAEACYTEHNLTLLLQEKEDLEKTLLEERYKWAQAEKRMKGTIERLRTKVEYLSNTNTSLKQQLSMMHSSSLKRLTSDNDHQSILEELVQHMSEEHTQLLHHHLAQLRLYAEVCELTKTSQEDSASKQVLVPDLGDQSQNISEMMSSEDTMGNMEQTVVTTITAEEDSGSLGNIVSDQNGSAEQDTLTMDTDVRLPSNDGVALQLTGGLSPQNSTSESRYVLYPSNSYRPTNNEGCKATQRDFHRDKPLKLILSDSTAKIFCPDGLHKRTFEKISNEGLPLKRRKTDSP